jgi:cytochrome c oxidase cbb3-type subunit 1
MGWVTLTACAGMYYVFPKVYNTTVHSVKLANTHFWLVFVGQLIYSISMWIAGVQQGAMLKMANEDGTLAYSFVETVARLYPYWQLRTVGGVIFTVGMLVFIYNIVMTIRTGRQNIASTERA